MSDQLREMAKTATKEAECFEENWLRASDSITRTLRSMGHDPDAPEHQHHYQDPSYEEWKAEAERLHDEAAVLNEAADRLERAKKIEAAAQQLVDHANDENRPAGEDYFYISALAAALTPDNQEEAQHE